MVCEVLGPLQNARLGSPKCAHFRGPALQTPPKFHERTPKRGRKKEKCGGRAKKREILVPPPFRAPHPSGPHPSRLPPFGPHEEEELSLAAPPQYGAALFGVSQTSMLVPLSKGWLVRNALPGDQHLWWRVPGVQVTAECWWHIYSAKKGPWSPQLRLCGMPGRHVVCTAARSVSNGVQRGARPLEGPHAQLLYWSLLAGTRMALAPRASSATSKAMGPLRSRTCMWK